MAPGFVFYDLVFLVLFTLGVVLFLYRRRKNLQRQGLLYLYRTKLGIRFIEWTSKRFPRTLNFLQYVVVISGYILMIGMIYMLIRFSYFYLTSPIAAQVLKVPVIVPLVPYLPEIFNLDFLPPFYFTYWIIIIAIIAIPHEFAHGIFARLHKIKIHSTGFGFLGPFLAAFVEPDEKDMAKRKNFPQLAILASGTFANIIFSIIFGLLFWLFFVSAFTPAGVIFNSYATKAVPIAEISSIDGNSVFNSEDIQNLVNESVEFTKIKVNDETLFVSSSGLLTALENDIDMIPAALDSPAFRTELSGAIKSVDGIEVRSFEGLRAILDNHKAGDEIVIEAIQDNNEIKEYYIELAEFDGKAFLGIGIITPQTKGILGWLYGLIARIKDPFVYYESSIGELGIFIYNLLWWCVLISISVALVNMLPLGMFDGGRFFYLSILGLTGSKLVSERAFKISTYLILGLIVVLMIKWVLIFV